MRNCIFALLLLAVALTTGCDDQARKFAAETKKILEQRSSFLSKKIAAEMAGYSAYTAKAVEDRRTLAIEALTNDHAERANVLAADYQANRKPVALWRKDLADGAQADFEGNRQLLKTDLDAETNYLQRYASLAIEQDKVDALATLLDALSQKRSLKDEATALAGFAEDTKKEFDSKVCDSLKSKTDAASKKLFADKKCS